MLSVITMNMFNIYYSVSCTTPGYTRRYKLSLRQDASARVGGQVGRVTDRSEVAGECKWLRHAGYDTTLTDGRSGSTFTITIIM